MKENFMYVPTPTPQQNRNQNDLKQTCNILNKYCTLESPLPKYTI